MKKLLYLFLTVLIVACSGEDNNNDGDNNNNTDTTPPIISLIGSANVVVNQGDTFIDEGATATDNVDGDLTSSITVSGNVDTAIIGNYVLNYSVSDAAGNNASATRNVSVIEPLVCLNGEVVYLDANGITVKACPDAQIGDTGNINGFTYTVVSEQQLRDYVNSNYPELNRLVTTQVTNMQGMFGNATSFNQPIGNWDVSSVTDMSSMFYVTSTFNQPIGDWDVSNVNNMWAMFKSSSFNQPIGNWDVSSVTDMYDMFGNASFNQPIGDWDVSSVTYMAYMFRGAISFNQDLSSWSVDGVLNCEDFSTDTPQWTLPQPNFTNCTP